MVGPGGQLITGQVFEMVNLFEVLYLTLLHPPPSDSSVSEDAWVEPRTVATLALAVRRSKH